MSSDFSTLSHAKWILTGEHAVLRGHPALVFPLTDKTLSVHYEASKEPLRILQPGAQHLNTLLWQVINEGVELLKLKPMPTGILTITNTIPWGVGLGASAALCVAMARWFEHLNPGLVEPFELARKLEHIFHGQSSGLDIAGASATRGQGIYFQQGTRRQIELTWQPHWFLSASGEVGMTSHCIDRVQTLREQNEANAEAIDQKMANSVAKAHQALIHPSCRDLAHAINEAHDCFLQWGLITPILNQHMQSLRDAGAIAVKPTGSGGGGHVLSLWNAEPPSTMATLIRL